MDEERRDPPEEAPYSKPGDAGEPLTEEDGTGAGTSSGTHGEEEGEPGVGGPNAAPRREQPGL
jgi:hypothetical protein